MSESVPEQPTGPSRGKPGGKPDPGTGGKLGVWGKKLGPLPAWAWGGIVLGSVLIFMYIRNKGNTNANAGAATADASTAASQIPQFVNQTYTNTTPPTAPPPPVPDPGGPDVDPPPTPAHKGHKHHKVNPGGPFRHVADGHQSLHQVAKARHTTPAHLLAESRKNAGKPGHLTRQNLDRLNDYAKTGTNKPMPKGLVYYTGVGPPEGS